jgi:7-carboxy-7-deazaguanine synthase
MINIQPIEKPSHTDGQVLQLHSIFDTMQGEGPFTGHPAVFVRLAGCNLQCPGCDTDYTEGRKIVGYEDIIRDVSALRKAPWLVVITGGEPFRQNIAPLVNQLNADGYIVQIETNGTLRPSPSLTRSCIIVCSPKAGKINPVIAARDVYYKYVMDADSIDHTDGLPLLALGHSASPRVGRPPTGYTRKVYLQPMDPGAEYPLRYKKNLSAVIESCMKYGHILQLQTHKIIGME